MSSSSEVFKSYMLANCWCLTLHKNPKNIFSLFSLILSKFFFYNYEVGFLQSSSLVCKSFQFMCAACITPIFLSYYGILSIFFFLRTMHNKGTHLRKNMNAEKLLLVNFSISESKSNQAMKLGQLTGYKKRNIFLQKLWRKWG